MADYYVSPSGSNLNSGDITHPFFTVNKGMSVTGPNDTCWIRAGTYAELFDTGSGTVINTGTDWNNPTTIRAYPGETPIIQGTSNDTGFNLRGNLQYVQFIGLTFDGFYQSWANGGVSQGATIVWLQNRVSATIAPNHLRFASCIFANITGYSVSCLFMDKETGFAGCNNNEILSCQFRECTDIGVAHNSSPISNQSHHCYIHSNNNLWENCLFTLCNALSFQFFKSSGLNADCSNNIVRKCIWHDNGSPVTNSSALTVAIGDGNQVYNNIFYNNPQHMRVEYGATNTLIYNNTFYTLTFSNAAHITIGENAGFAGINASGTIVKDNVCNGTPVGRNSVENRGTSTSNPGTHIEYNVLDRGTSDLTGVATIANNIASANPLWVNAASANFHLQSLSPCRNAGASTAPTVTTDYDGVARPQETLYGIGAFEFPVSVPPPRAIIMPQVQIIGGGDEEEYD